MTKHGLGRAWPFWALHSVCVGFALLGVLGGPLSVFLLSKSLVGFSSPFLQLDVSLVSFF